MKEWKVDMINILIEYYKLYKEEGLEYTSDIKNVVMAERRSNDYIQDFIDTYIEKKDG